MKNTLIKQSLTALNSRKINRTILFGAGLLALSCVAAFAQQTTGVPGSPDATIDDQWEATSAARPEVRRRNQRKCPAIENLVGTSR